MYTSLYTNVQVYMGTLKHINVKRHTHSNEWEWSHTRVLTDLDWSHLERSQRRLPGGVGSDDGMKVVINNWSEDEEKEGMDDWRGITMDYLIHAALCTQKCLCDSVCGWHWHITHRLIYGVGGASCQQAQINSTMCSVCLEDINMYKAYTNVRY